MSYLQTYLERIRSKGNTALADAIQKTVDEVVPQYISNFSFTDHVVSLLVGDVQSGKTSHMFGLMCAAADECFLNFVLLTTDNILLQQQTFKRAEKDLCDFCVCDENDYLKFLNNNLRKPAVIVLKKNGRVLKKWKDNFASTSFCAGNPLFIVDDEADAASLNEGEYYAFDIVGLEVINQDDVVLGEITDILKTGSNDVYITKAKDGRQILIPALKKVVTEINIQDGYMKVIWDENQEV